jgi:hypothetical protein
MGPTGTWVPKHGPYKAWVPQWTLQEPGPYNRTPVPNWTPDPSEGLHWTLIGPEGLIGPFIGPLSPGASTPPADASQ